MSKLAICLLGIILLCSCSTQTVIEPDVLAWGTSREKVEQTLNMDLIEKTKNELKYNTPTDIGEKAEIYYSFDDKNNGLQAFTKIIDFKYASEIDHQKRLENLNLVYEQYKNKYGPGTYTKDKEFEGYSWELENKLVRVILSEGTPESVFVAYYNPDYVKNFKAIESHPIKQHSVNE